MTDRYRVTYWYPLLFNKKEVVTVDYVGLFGLLVRAKRGGVIVKYEKIKE